MNYHQVFNAGNSVSFALDAELGFIDDTEAYSIGGVAYFTPNMGLGLDVYAEEDDFYGETLKDLTLSYHYFATNNVGFEVSYSENETEAFYEDYMNLWRLGMQVNF